MMYFKGQGTPKDYTQAAYWYKKAALQNNVKAQINLAFLYCTGLEVPQNLDMCLEWSRKAENNDYNLTIFWSNLEKYNLKYLKMYPQGNDTNQ